MANSFANHLLEDDDNYKVYVHQSILRLQAIFGPIKHKFAFGEVSREIVEKIVTKEEEDRILTQGI